MSQGQSKVLLNVRQNCWRNCYLVPKIRMRHPFLRL